MIETASAQNSCPSCEVAFRSRLSASAVGMELGYFGCERMRTHPFSVSGQVAHPCPRRASSHWWALSTGKRSKVSRPDSCRSALPSFRIQKELPDSCWSDSYWLDNCYLGSTRHSVSSSRRLALWCRTLERLKCQFHTLQVRSLKASNRNWEHFRSSERLEPARHSQLVSYHNLNRCPLCRI